MPRAVALDLLDKVLRRHRPLDEALESHPALPKLERRDRAFARMLATTTLRRLGQIDALVDHCLDRRLPPKAKPALDVMRIGVCQLLFLETPAHAAVDTSVRLAEKRKLGPYKKLINAVLRRLGREGRDLLAAQDAGRLDTPDWLWKSWSAAYGEDTARAIAEAHLKEAPLDLSLAADAEAWAERLGAELLPTGSLRLRPSGPVSELEGFDAGAWWVQDAAAALPARLLGDVAGKTVFDLCAAPGGKTAQLCAAGARVVAVERSENRAKRLRENLERLGHSAEVAIADVAAWTPPEPADAILLDAPCSATGTLRRHPDVARLKTEADVARLAAVQAKLLAAAAERLRSGGTLVYCTCSLQPEEGPERIAAFLAENPEFSRLPVAADEVGGEPGWITAEGDLRTLPNYLAERGGLDGFFAARLRKT